jgi:hypothetical protein
LNNNNNFEEIVNDIIVSRLNMVTDNINNNINNIIVSMITKFLSLDAISSDWVVTIPQAFNPYVGNTTSEGGCNVDIRDITNDSAILFPEYDASGNASLPVKFWLVNDTTVTISQGKRVRIALSSDIEDIDADDFKGLALISFLGYANTLTGEIDTSDMAVNGSSIYQGDAVTNLALQKDLPPNWAYILQVQMAFDLNDVDKAIPQGAVLKIYPRITPNFSEYDPAADLLGNYIIPWGENRRILPDGTGVNLIAGTGSGSIAYYKFRKLGRQIVPGMVANTANQKVIITNNGVCFVSDTVPEDTSALRAIVGTVNGVGNPTSWSASIALDSTTVLSLTLTHPTNIRSDYPDVIAGMAANLNASKIRVYVRSSGGTIQYFDVPIVGETGEVVTVGGLAGVTIADLPAIAANFSCFNEINTFVWIGVINIKLIVVVTNRGSPNPAPMLHLFKS